MVDSRHGVVIYFRGCARAQGTFTVKNTGMLRMLHELGPRHTKCGEIQILGNDI
jgi:hypothetical protein